MEFLKNLFKDDDRITGLCALKEEFPKRKSPIPDFSSKNLVFITNTKNNFLLS